MSNYRFFLPFFLLSFLVKAQLVPLPYELSTNNTKSILIDDRNLLWVGTNEGLNLTDNIEFFTFYSNIKDTLSLLNSETNALFQLHDHHVAALSKGGISIFNPKKNKFIQLVLPSSPLTILKDDKESNYWVTTENSGIFVYNELFQKVNHFLYDPLNPLSVSTSKFLIEETSSIDFNDPEKVFIGTSNGFNIYSRKQNIFKRLFKKKGSSLLSNKIIGLARIDDQKLLVASDGGLNIYNTKNENFDENFILPDFNVLALSKITKDEFLVATQQGVYVLTFKREQPFKFQKLNLPAGFDYPTKISVFDSKVFLWSKEQTSYLEYNQQSNKLEPTNLPYPINDIYFSVEFDKLIVSTINGLFTKKNNQLLVLDTGLKNNSLYFGNHEYNLFSVFSSSIAFYNLNYDVIKTYRLPKSFSENSINSYFQQLDHYLLMGNNSLSIVDLNTGKYYEDLLIADDLFEERINNIKVVDDVLYLSLDNGVVTVDLSSELLNSKGLNATAFKENKKEYEFNTLLNKNIPHGFFDVLKIGDFLWVSSSNKGLSLYKNDLNTWVKDFSYRDNDLKTIASNSITKLFFDENSEELFIGTRGDGLFRYSTKDSIFSNFKTDSGILSNNILGFLSLDQILWIQTGNGLNYMVDDATFNSLNIQDGLDINRYHETPLHKIEESVYISGYDNIQSFNLNSLVQDSDDFSIDLLKVTAFNRNNNASNVEISSDNVIDVNYRSSSIILNFFTTEDYKVDQIKYFYSSDKFTEGKLMSNGFDNLLKLQSLPYYTSDFEIYAVNSSGKRSINSIKFSINNAPPLWIRFEAIAFYIISLILFVYFFGKYREKQTFKRLEGERKSQELEEARDLQNSLLPKRLPKIKNFQISTYLKSATEIGGDYYDFFNSEDENFYAVCGDATGHGVISGIMVSVTKAGLNGIPMKIPSHILGSLNKIVKRVNFGRLRMSLSVAKFKENEVEISSAAMPPTYLYSAKNDAVEELMICNLPLGGIESEQYSSVKRPFESGDVMVMISDGLPELPNPENELLDYPEIMQCISDNRNSDSDTIQKKLVTLADSWAQGVMNPDDITIVVIKKTA